MDSIRNLLSYYEYASVGLFNPFPSYAGLKTILFVKSLKQLTSISSGVSFVHGTQPQSLLLRIYDNHAIALLLFRTPQDT